MFIYFIRHGEVYNPNQILYGKLPRFRLSPSGTQKIKKLASDFKSKNIKFIYSSPLLRTRQTAAIIGMFLGIKPKVSSLLTEVDLIFAGIKLSQYHDQIRYRLYSEEFLKKGQENVEQIFKRMNLFVKLVIKRHKNNNLIVVSHGDPIMIFKAVSSGNKFDWDYKRNNYLKTGEYITLKVTNNRLKWV